mgnify:CR=1 FL=1
MAGSEEESEWHEGDRQGLYDDDHGPNSAVLESRACQSTLCLPAKIRDRENGEHNTQKQTKGQTL